VGTHLLNVNPIVHKFHQARLPVKYSLDITWFPPYGLRLQQLACVLPVRY